MHINKSVSSLRLSECPLSSILILSSKSKSTSDCFSISSIFSATSKNSRNALYSYGNFLKRFFMAININQIKIHETYHFFILICRLFMHKPGSDRLAQIAWWLSRANVDCFVLVIELRQQTGFRCIGKSFQTTLARLFYLSL